MFCISNYSHLVSWSSWNSRNMATTTVIWRNTPLLSPILQSMNIIVTYFPNLCIWVNHFGWLQLCVAGSIGTNMTYCWKLFHYGVKIEHYEKLIGIRELSEQLAQDWFNDPFSLETGIPEKNTLPLDEVGEGQTFSTYCELHFQFYSSLCSGKHYFRHKSIQCFMNIYWISEYCWDRRIYIGRDI